jgi:hypothetical protein
MYWVGYLLALLAAVVVGWAVPLVGLAILVPLFQLIYTLQPLVATILMVAMGGLLAWYSVTRQAYWQAAVWGLLWGLGALTAALGVFHWYALFLECVLVIVLLIPGVVAPWWGRLLRWFATGEILLSLVLIWGQGQGLPGGTLVMALLLLLLAGLLGLGAYRPFEARRIRRRLATMATVAAAALLLWQSVVLPAAGWVGQAAGEIGQAVATSPIGRWYRVASLQAERRELAEEAKTEGLRQLQSSLTDAHKRRWEKAIGDIPNLPLDPGEWGELGVPRE